MILPLWWCAACSAAHSERALIQACIYTAGSFAPFLDTIWNSRFSSALNQKKANPKQPVAPNMRPALPRLPDLPQNTALKEIARSDLTTTPRKSSVAGPNERNRRRLHGSLGIF
ncbi:hypothetical protein LOD99_793 [Oopsacas minuta]|uniref:Secreted protein n=1 Tax=Oopsacas minuta TaxID=111878 RepID=A0AAV7JZP2_9METZ|nr:hypothetical protein LOD99_793 [Oopsacas minuta]